MHALPITLIYFIAYCRINKFFLLNEHVRLLIMPSLLLQSLVRRMAGAALRATRRRRATVGGCAGRAARAGARLSPVPRARVRCGRTGGAARRAAAIPRERE